jgi:hypothetical protein
MQSTPAAASSRLPIVVIAVAIVLALIGIGGIASGAADKPSDDVATSGGTTTTTDLGGFGGGDGGDSGVGSSLTTLPGAPGTTTPTTQKSTTGTTAKSTTGTTSLDAVGDCAAPAASSTDPGAEQAPAVGTYTYVSCTDSSDTTDVKVAAAQSGNGVTRRDVTEEAGGLSQTATEAYGPNGILQEVLTIKTGFADIKCDWNPDVLLFPAQLSVGKTWTADSKCTVTNPQDPSKPITLHLTADGKISGRVAANVGGTTVNCWVLDAHVKLDTPNGAVDLTEHDHFDPVHGVNVYRHSESHSAQGNVTRIDKLKSITPK